MKVVVWFVKTKLTLYLKSLLLSSIKYNKKKYSRCGLKKNKFIILLDIFIKKTILFFFYFLSLLTNKCNKLLF